MNPFKTYYDMPIYLLFAGVIVLCLAFLLILGLSVIAAVGEYKASKYGTSCRMTGKELFDELIRFSPLTCNEKNMIGVHAEKKGRSYYEASMSCFVLSEKDLSVNALSSASNISSAYAEMLISREQGRLQDLKQAYRKGLPLIYKASLIMASAAILLRLISVQQSYVLAFSAASGVGGMILIILLILANVIGIKVSSTAEKELEYTGLLMDDELETIKKTVRRNYARSIMLCL